MFVYTPPPPSAEARELGERVAETVRRYRAEHPGVSARDVGQGLRIAGRSLDRELGASPSGRRVLTVLLALGVLAFGAVTYLNDSGASAETSGMVMVAIVILGLLALLVARR